MKPTIVRTALLFVAILFFTSMTVSTNVVIKPQAQKEFNDFFSKRSLLYSSIPELETRYKKKFNFIQQFKINQAKKKNARQLQSENLLDGCDTIKLKNGEQIIAVVNEIGTTEIKYKKCENKTGPTYSLKRSDIYMIRYANGSKDFFGNEQPAGENKDDLVNSAAVKTDPLAIASIAAVAIGTIGLFAAAPILSILIPVGIVLGFVSKSKINKSNGKVKGTGLAIAAIVGGFVVIALSFLAVIIFVSAL